MSDVSEARQQWADGYCGGSSIIATCICTKCGETKPISEFRLGKSRAGNQCRHGSCDACQSRAAAQWNKDHRTRRNERVMRTYHATTKFDQRFIEKSRTAGREAQRRRRIDPGFLLTEREKAKTDRLRRVTHFLMKSAKSRAKKKRLPFDLTIDWAKDRWTGRCELSGIEFRPSSGRQNPYSPSIDRIDGTKGYVRTNCRFILSAINYLKANGTDEQMFHIASELTARRP